MINLKKNSFIFLLIVLFACSTSSYRIIGTSSNRVEINVTPDRVFPYCEPQPDMEIKDLFGFHILVLDEVKTILFVTQTNVLDKEGCHKRLDKIRRILKKGTNIYIGGMGNLNNPRKEEKNQYTIPEHGTFHSNSRMLQFMVIANEHGDCYSAYQGDSKPCPRGEFPIKQ